MNIYKGRIAFEGIAINKIAVYEDAASAAKKAFTSEENEYNRFKEAREKAVSNLSELYLDALEKLGKDEAILFETHRLMAEDLDFDDLVHGNISQGKIAEDAVHEAASELGKMFSSLDDEYMKARAADVIEVGEDICDILLGRDKIPKLTEPTILVCNDLPASLLMKFDREYLKGLVLIKGNVNSHVSIFARTLELPTVVSVEGLEVSKDLNDKIIILDATKGTIIVDPIEDKIKEYKRLNQEYINDLLTLKSYIGKPSVTKDGFKLKIYANIASAYEVSNILKKDAEGVGLFRSEFIYLSSKNYPTEDLQFNYYREVVEEMKGKEVIIRTLDIGADKKVPYFNLPYEDNPAMGYRSIRICRDREDMFLTQLKALYRASAYGKLSIMIPMIISKEEVLFSLEMCKKAREELKKDKIKFDPKVKIGIMIETPAAALMSDELAKLVDFFSIGTNDLSQYTLACDRLNPNLFKTFDSHHPAILRLIKMTVENAHKNGIICGMCGEMARDLHVLPFLIALHIDELSCSSAYVLKVRKEISKLDSRKINIDKYLS